MLKTEDAAQTLLNARKTALDSINEILSLSEMTFSPTYKKPSILVLDPNENPKHPTFSSSSSTRAFTIRTDQSTLDKQILIEEEIRNMEVDYSILQLEKKVSEPESPSNPSPFLSSIQEVEKEISQLQALKKQAIQIEDFVSAKKHHSNIKICEQKLAELNKQEENFRNQSTASPTKETNNSNTNSPRLVLQKESSSLILTSLSPNYNLSSLEEFWKKFFARCDFDQPTQQQYVQTFVENEISEKDLPDLDHEILQSMDISIAKTRLRILRARNQYLREYNLAMSEEKLVKNGEESEETDEEQETNKNQPETNETEIKKQSRETILVDDKFLLQLESELREENETNSIEANTEGKETTTETQTKNEEEAISDQFIQQFASELKKGNQTSFIQEKPIEEQTETSFTEEKDEVSNQETENKHFIEEKQPTKQECQSSNMETKEETEDKSFVNQEEQNQQKNVETKQEKQTNSFIEEKNQIQGEKKEIAQEESKQEEKKVKKSFKEMFDQFLNSY